MEPPMLSAFSFCKNTDGGGNGEERSKEASMDTGAETGDHQKTSGRPYIVENIGERIQC